MGEGNGGKSGGPWKGRQVKCPLCGGNKVTALERAFVIDNPVEPKRPPLAITPIRCNATDCGAVYFIPEHPGQQLP